MLGKQVLEVGTQELEDHDDEMGLDDILVLVAYDMLELANGKLGLVHYLHLEH